MNRLRLMYQRFLTAIARPLSLNGRLFQFCDRCGRVNSRRAWWDSTNKVWEAVAGNVNGCRHGCFCPDCFTDIAREKGILLNWQPEIVVLSELAGSEEGSR